MADLHRAGRYDRMSDDVLTLIGKVPMSMREFVLKYSANFHRPVLSGLSIRA
jgi:hypothetical protein